MDILKALKVAVKKMICDGRNLNTIIKKIVLFK